MRQDDARASRGALIPCSIVQAGSRSPWGRVL